MDKKEVRTYAQYILYLISKLKQVIEATTKVQGTAKQLMMEKSKTGARTVSPQGMVALALHEGIVPGPYLDSQKVWTWGIGHTAAAGAPYPVSMPRGMPKDLDSAVDHVMQVFARDLEAYTKPVLAAVKIPLAQHELDALVSFHYNTGAIARAQLTKLLNAGDRKGAAAAFMGWRKPPKILGRRIVEQKLFSTGAYPTGSIPVWSVNSNGKLTWRTAKMLSVEQLLSLLEKHTLVA